MLYIDQNFTTIRIIDLNIHTKYFLSRDGKEKKNFEKKNRFNELLRGNQDV